MCLVILHYAEGKDTVVPPLVPPTLRHYNACIQKKGKCPEMNWTMSLFVKGSINYHPYFSVQYSIKRLSNCPPMTFIIFLTRILIDYVFSI